MKKDILQKKVDQLAIVVSPRPASEDPTELWDTYLINLYDQPINSVLVSSRGYGEVDGEKMATTTLRHFFEEIGPREMVPIEPIQPSLFKLNNEFWVSFMYEEYMYDKKYLFAQNTIHERQFTNIPFSDRQGVVMK